MLSSFSTSGNTKNHEHVAKRMVGLGLMIGGLAAGLVLVSQPQLLNQKAATSRYAPVRACVKTDCQGGDWCVSRGGKCSGMYPSCSCILTTKCTPGTSKCADNNTVVIVCDKNGVGTIKSCGFSCLNGKCTEKCVPNVHYCVENWLYKCNATGSNLSREYCGVKGCNKAQTACN